MTITYLGTAAAEGFPAVFCNCEACAEARRQGGRNLRTRSQTLINRDLLLDLPCDTYWHMLQNNLDLSAVRTLLVTHSHTDHFYPAELVLRGGCYAHDMTCGELDIYCNQTVLDYFYRAAGHELEQTVADRLHFHVAKPFEPFAVGAYRVTPLPAKHMQTERALFYLIEEEDGAFLYAHDTGRFYPEVYDYLAQSGVKLNLVSLDCTSGPLENGEEGGHMSIPDDFVVKERLEQIGAVTRDTRIIMNHFSHNGGLLHEELRRRAEPLGFTIAYDGLTVTL